MFRRITVSLLVATGLVGLFAGSSMGASGATGVLRVTAPLQVSSGATAALKVRLPAGIAAVDGRVFIDTSAAELVGVSATNGATALTPQAFNGGYAFGVYGMRAGAAPTLTFSIAADTDGRLPFRIVLDAAADALGKPVGLGSSTAAGSVSFGTATTTFAPAQNASRRLSTNLAGATRDLVPDRQIGATDIDVVRAGWESKHVNDDPCTGDTYGADANGDGCVDIVDVQAVLGHQKWTVANGVAAAPASTNSNNPDGSPSTGKAAAVAVQTFTVTSSNDAADAHQGDGVCADQFGRCTLRAAVTEANWAKGASIVAFNIPGSTPATIQLSNNLPQMILQDRSGGTLIDGYTQPGSRANTSQYASNAIPGVYIVGTGSNPRQSTFRITSADNTVRGLILNSNDKAIVIDGPDAHGNLIAGDWLNYSRDGSPSSFKGHYNLWIANGAHHNKFGTPALADRNLTGSSTKGAAMYGPGTDFNVFQNNLFCMMPNGTSAATCDVGTDFSFGPKHNLIGGTNPGELNVYGPNTQQCIEFAHDKGVNDTDTWKNEDNSIIGNWLGFRADGSYASSFRCGSNNYSNNSNDSNGVNLADGSSYNIVQGNWIGSYWDGINIMSSNETGNIVRGNIIGESPRGEPAPMSRYGIEFRAHAKGHVIIGNTIKNTAGYGVAITLSDITHITVSQNIITDTSSDAINLVNGANGGIQPPRILTATNVHVTGTGVAGATVEIFKASRGSGRSGLPTAFVGSATVASNGNWDVSISGIASGDFVTALQTNTAGNTSALSTNASAGFEQTPPPPVAGFTWSQVSGFNVAFHDTSTGTVGQRAWDFGDGAASTQQNPSHAYAAAGNYSVKLTVSNAGGSNSVTNQVAVLAAPPVASDAFGRTVANGWGSADTGGAYAVQGTAANYAVNGTVGTMSVAAGSTRSALLSANSAQNVDVSFRVAANQVAAGGNYIVYAVARHAGTSEYRAKLIFNSKGTIQVAASVLVNGTETALGSPVTVVGLTPSANGYVRVHAQFTGANPTTINVRAWADGQAEPAAWQFTITDASAALQGAGTVGLRAYLASGVTNAPVTFSFDDYAATTVTP